MRNAFEPLLWKMIECTKVDNERIDAFDVRISIPSLMKGKS